MKVVVKQRRLQTKPKMMAHFSLSYKTSSVMVYKLTLLNFYQPLLTFCTITFFISFVIRTRSYLERITRFHWAKWPDSAELFRAKSSMNHLPWARLKRTSSCSKTHWTFSIWINPNSCNSKCVSLCRKPVLLKKKVKKWREIQTHHIILTLTFCIFVIANILLPHRQIKYPVDFDDKLKTRKRQIR